MKEIIINYDNQKSDIVVLENGNVIEKYQEYDNNRTIEGNIYLGKVINVLPGMRSSFCRYRGRKKCIFTYKRRITKSK